jgi:chromosome transmission fidelity protein 4
MTIRLKVWNNIGIVRCHSEEEPASIDIEFHDSSLHHSMNLINHLNHTMAALSETAVLLACQANEELPRYVNHDSSLSMVCLCTVEKTVSPQF